MENSGFPREVFYKSTDQQQFKICVFLGVYNGNQYLKSLKTQLLSQTNQEFQLIVVDNNSTDNSFELIKEWKQIFGPRITIVRNNLNLGGTGTILNNMDLINSDWFTAFHQDDYYTPKHIEVLLNEIKNAPEKVVAISTIMASMDADGRTIGTVPRSNMFIKSNKPLSSFLQNLRVHSVPWPATAFKCSIYKRSGTLWHSTAFPDTEQILRMCAYGEFVTINKETMFYRENPTSESHSVANYESEIGSALSLFRVFGSREFEILTTHLNANEVELFGLELMESINFRMKGSALSGFLCLYAIEMLIQGVGYQKPGLLVIAESLYRELKSNKTSELLLNIAGESGAKSGEQNTSNLKYIENLRNYCETKTQILPERKNRFNQVITSKYFQKLPFGWKKKILVLIINSGKLFGKFNQFKFEWR